MRRNVLGNIFRIQGQHPDLPLPRAEKVDDPDTSALAAPGQALACKPIAVTKDPSPFKHYVTIQKAVNAMYKGGTMTKILKKWNMSQFALVGK